jgi:predicted DNA-binding protein (UPF0251 family)
MTMSVREVERLKVVQQVIEKKLSWKEAAERLGIKRRQVGRLVHRVKAKGNKGIIHGLRGKPSNHQIQPEVVRRALELVQLKYPDFGPTFANEKLLEKHKLRISTTLLRKEMIKAGVWKAKRSKRRHRAWRERRACFGELVQLDGSIHDWFEGRSNPCWLLGYVDDATGKTFARFVDAEDTKNLMLTSRLYFEKYGRPGAFYVDKDSIYKINRQASIEEELRELDAESQFTRAMRELGIEVICANSPQAKGRVERGFGTHQDRLVKELRLAGINDPQAGNCFLEKMYLPKHNERFGVEAANPRDAHRPLLQTHNLDAILSTRVERTVGNDYTVLFKNQLYQVLEDQPVRVGPKDRVYMERRLDGSLHMLFKSKYLNYERIETRPVRKQLLKLLPKVRKLPIKPKASHPWRNARRWVKRQTPVSNHAI